MFAAFWEKIASFSYFEKQDCSVTSANRSYQVVATRVCKHQDLKMFDLKLKTIFTHLKSWVAVVGHNFKWAKI